MPEVVLHEARRWFFADRAALYIALPSSNMPAERLGLFGAVMRTIRHYSNGKLYDAHESHNVGLDALAALIRHGEEIQVIDYKTGRDLTAVVLAQIMFEEERHRPRLPVVALHKIIQTGRVP